MSKYTITIDEYINGLYTADHPDASIIDVINMDETERYNYGKTLFPANYPIFDISKKEEFEKLFLANFGSRELAVRPVAYWKRLFYVWLYTNMPKYTDLWNSKLSEIDEYINDIDITRTDTGTITTQQTGTAESHSTQKETGTIDNDSTQRETGTVDNDSTQTETGTVETEGSKRQTLSGDSSTDVTETATGSDTNTTTESRKAFGASTYDEMNRTQQTGNRTENRTSNTESEQSQTTNESDDNTQTFDKTYTGDTTQTFNKTYTGDNTQTFNKTYKSDTEAEDEKNGQDVHNLLYTEKGHRGNKLSTVEKYRQLAFSIYDVIFNDAKKLFMSIY